MKEQFIQGPSLSERVAMLESIVRIQGEQIDMMRTIVFSSIGAVVFALGAMAFLWLKRR